MTSLLRAGRSRRSRDPVGRVFSTVTIVLGLTLAAASAPSPLYSAYGARWHFGAITVTAVFAVYALALLGALLVFGSASDRVGRRAVILAGLALLAVSMILFLLAGSVAWLFAARIVQGIATALVTAGVSAALIDLQPAHRPGFGALVNAVTPTVGLAIGAVAAGALVQYAPLPLRLTYAVLLVGCLVLLLLVARISDGQQIASGTERRLLDLRPVDLRPQIGVEAQVRAAFVAVLPGLVAAWALGGLYLSLGPSLLLELADSHNRLLGGSSVFALCAPGAVASVFGSRWPPRRILRRGCILLVVGLAITIAAVATGEVPTLFLGTAVSGTGFGMSFLGAFRTLIGQASVERRGQLVAAIYIVAYLAFSLPAVIAGVLTTHIGLRATTIAFAAVVILLALTALLMDTVHRARPA